MEENKDIETQIPEELQFEINKLRKKDKIYTWLFTGILSIALIGGAWLYTQRNSTTDGSNGYATNYNQKGVTTASYGNNGVTNAYNSNGTTAPNGTAGGCCGGGASGRSTTSKEQLSALETQALDSFKTKFGDQKVTAKASDYGCHIQIDIYDSNKKLIHSYAYRGGQMNLIS